MTEPANTTTATETTRMMSRRHIRWALLAVAVLIIVAAVRVVTGTDDLFAPGTVRAALIATCPILLAALGGLWSERAGVINIGLEGQMILGTWGAAFFTYHYGPWAGLAGAIAFGLIGGLLHALATVTFGVDHIVSGVAINLIGAGIATFLAEAIFPHLDGGGPRRLVGLDAPPRITVPGVSDVTIRLADQHWFLISDLAAIIAGITTKVSVVTLLVVVLVIASAWILWRTTFGLRLRSCGENPEAAESLGIDVYRYKFIAVLTSGGFAGLGGGYLALVSASGFSSGQTGGRGYIGLAAMIFGNWHPGGLLTGALTFGYTDALRLRSPGSIHALLLLVALILAGAAAWQWLRNRGTMAVPLLVLSVLITGWFALTDSVPKEFAGMTPYIITILVLAVGTQRLRMPAADGRQYRRGTSG